MSKQLVGSSPTGKMAGKPCVHEVDLWDLHEPFLNVWKERLDDADNPRSLQHGEPDFYCLVVHIDCVVDVRSVEQLSRPGGASHLESADISIILIQPAKNSLTPFIRRQVCESASHASSLSNRSTTVIRFGNMIPKLLPFNSRRRLRHSPRCVG